MENLNLLKVSEVTLNYEPKIKPSDRPRISNSQSANKVARKFLQDHNKSIYLKEYFLVLFLNNSNRVLGVNMLSEGGITGTLVDIRLLFASALKSLATAIILVHNHPSGTGYPSEADKSLTQKIKNAAQVLDIKLLDHVILYESDCYSFADEGIL